MRHSGIAACCLMTVALMPGLAFAQSLDYPSRQVTIIVPTGPGASTDIEARLYAQKLSERIGRSFVVDYKPGAGQTLGSAFVARANPDGHTLLTVAGSFTATPALMTLSYDPARDFAPISLMSNRTTVILANPGVPYKTVPEYIAHARAHPGEVNVATNGSGGSPHLNAAWFHSLTNTKVTFVHYKAAGLTLTDLIAGRVDTAFSTLLSGLAHIKSGKLRALGIASAERSPMLPGVLPAAEQGVTGYNYASWFGIVAPGGTPPAIIDKLNAELVRISRLPDIMAKLEADGGSMVGSTPQQLRQVIVSEMSRYKKLIQDTGIKLEE